MMVFVVPKLGVILKDLGGPDAKLPAQTQAMLSISDFTRKNLVLILLTLGISASASRNTYSTRAGSTNTTVYS